ncbi:MAG: octaprenyl-diphosphate synthase [Candidatus Azotimanducaceae bacterium]|jgi:octaprenyl-diphosphate synthase
MNYPFYNVVNTEFEAVNKLIIGSLSSHVPLVEEISNYLIDAGGKRLRPLLVLLAAKSLGYELKEHIKLAAIIEFLHTAMLLHDDVVDESLLRRGRKTVNAEWGNPASVLVGDFLHSRAFEMMVEIGDMKVMQILSFATNTIAEGEVQQLTNIRNPDITEERYLEVINRKTAMLFEASSHAGAVLASSSKKGVNQDLIQSLRHYGQHLGMAFQLIDDALDYEGTTEQLGKNVGDDLAEGKVTLPIIAAMRNGSKDETQLLRSAIQNGGLDNLDEVMEIVIRTGGLDYTNKKAEIEIQKALLSLKNVPDSAYKDAMVSLANFSISRNT